MPISRTFALDRIPTMVELYKIVDHSDIRGKELTLVLSSSGIREGAKLLLLQNIKSGKI